MGSTDWDLEFRSISLYYGYSVMSMKGDGSMGPSSQRATAVTALGLYYGTMDQQKFFSTMQRGHLWDLHQYQHRTCIFLSYPL